MHWLIELLELLGLVSPDTPDATAPPRVIVSVRDDVSAPYQDAMESRLVGADAAAWAGAIGVIPGLTFARLHSSLAPSDLQALMDRAAAESGEPAPNLFAWYAVTCPADVGPDVLAGVLGDLPFVTLAYAEAASTLPSFSTADPLVPNQGYLRPAPEGIDARYAWDVPGGDGSGSIVLDVEKGWDLGHEDLTSAHVTLLGGGQIAGVDMDHGTAVLGVLTAEPNGVGCIGIVPNAKVFVELGGSAIAWVADAISRVVQKPTSVIPQLGRGHVLLIEISHAGGGPAELDPGVFTAIRTATQAGVVIIEVAGNDGVDLKTFVADKTPNHILDPDNGGEFADSAGIIVGAALSSSLLDGRHRRASFSNFGKRVDCYAWGENVQTLQSLAGPAGQVRGYTGVFSGTSSASAIVAGIATAVQSMAKLAGGAKSPADIRNMFRDPTLTTGSAPAAPGPIPEPSGGIGGMPNLRAIARRLGIIRPTGLTPLKIDANTLRLFGVLDTSDVIGVWGWTRGSTPDAWTALTGPTLAVAPTARPVSAVSRPITGGQTTDVFFIYSTGALGWTVASTAAPSTWATRTIGPGGVPLDTTGRTAAVARRPDRMDVFAVGSDAGLYQASWASPNWSPLTRIGGAQAIVATGGLAGVAPTANTLHVVAIGDSPTALFTTRWSGEPPRQYNWLPMAMIAGAAPARPNGGPALTSRTQSASRALVDVFVVCDDQHVYSSFFDTSANPLAWAKLFVVGNDIKMDALAGVAAVARTTDNLDVFAIGLDGLLYTIWWQGSPAIPWGTWLQIGGSTKLAAGGRIAAVARGATDIEVFVVGADGHFLTLRWTGTWPTVFTAL